MNAIRKNITLSKIENDKITQYAKKTGKTFSEVLREATLKFIEQVEEIELSTYLLDNCSPVSEKEGAEIEQIINATDLDDKGVEITLDTILHG